MPRRISFSLLLLLFLLASPVLAKDPPKAPDLEDVKTKFISEGPRKDRAKAGAALAFWYPETMAVVLDQMIKDKKPEDLDVITKVAVMTTVRHVQFLLAWAASQWGEPAVAAFLDKIDNDFPEESARAAGLLGFIGDRTAYDRLFELLANEDEFTGVEAARSLARLGNRKDIPELVERTLNVDNRHVRQHLVWVVQDLSGGRKKAAQAFAKFRARKGTYGFRAKEALDVLEDELTRPEKYKPEFGMVRKFFGHKGGVKPPAFRAPKNERERILKVLDAMKVKTPAYHHLICEVVDVIEVSSGEWRFDLKRGAVNLRYADMIKWNRDELVEYYLVRYASILCLVKLGDPQEGHRGWERGMIDGWWYAMDHTLIAVEEDLKKFVKDFLKNPPW